MTWLYILLAVVTVAWFVWVTCRILFVMGQDLPAPASEETVLCFRCGQTVSESELASHTCGE